MKTRILATAYVAVGVASGLVIPVAHSGPPQAFDGWSANKGDIAASCATGLKCEVLGSGPGFLQRSLTDPVSGKGYFQTIVTTGTATGLPIGNLGFSDESFVRSYAGSASSPPLAGIADKQIINAQQSAGVNTSVFDSRTIILSGWAATAGAPAVDIAQKITEHNVSDGDFLADFKYTVTDTASDLSINQDVRAPGLVPGDDLASVFHYTAKGDGAGNRTGSRLAVSQNVGLALRTSTLEYGQGSSIQIPTTIGFDTDERQIFLLRRSSGVLATGSDILWIYHWQSTGLDPRQNAPLRGQWFGCEATSVDVASRCDTSSKHTTFSNPTTFDMSPLPFDPVPFALPRQIHSRDGDRGLYPSIAGGDKGGIVMASTGRQTGGLALASTGTVTHPDAPPPPPGAAPPVAVTNWSVSNGNITAPCPAGYSCVILVQDNGFLQMEIADARTGVSYYRTITTDKGASGAPTSLGFATDTVVRQSNSADKTMTTGVSAVTIVRDSAEKMANVTRLDLGWARSGAMPNMDIEQSSPAGQFAYLANFTQSGERSGMRLDIDQLDSSLTEKADSSFVHTAVGGDMLTRSGSAPLPGRTTTTWQAGDYVNATFISEKNTFRGGGHDPDKGSADLALDLNQSWGGAAISFISFDNLSSSQPGAGLISPKRSVDFLWVSDPFGPLSSRFGVTNGK